VRLHSGTTKSFIEDSSYNRIARKLRDAFFRYQPPVAEVNSWNNSLRGISQVFQTASLLDHGVLLELQLPLASTRLDCLVTGYNRKKAANAVLIMEARKRSFRKRGSRSRGLAKNANEFELILI
jgi:uncharacterized protein